MNSYPEVDYRPALGFRATVYLGLMEEFPYFLRLVDLVVLRSILSCSPSSLQHPWRIHRCSSLDQLFMPVEVPTPVKFATGAVLEQGLHGSLVVSWCLCPGQRRKRWRF